MTCLPHFLCRGAIALAFAFAAPAVAAADKGIDILISADAMPSPEGFRPKPGKPIHYLLFHSRQTLGTAVAGVKLPDNATVERAVVAELTKQGFVRTQEGGAIPDIVILAVVGDSNFKDEIPTGNPIDKPEFRSYMEAVNIRSVATTQGNFGRVPGNLDDLFETYPSPTWEIAQVQEGVVAEARRLRNRDPARKRHQIKTIVGAAKVERAVAAGTMSSSAAEKIAWATFDDQFFLTLSALEAKKGPDGGRAFLWRTTMLIDWRKDFAKALPAMLAHAGPVIGSDVAVPGFVNTARPRDGRVEIGDAKVVPESDPARTPGKKK